MSRARIPVVAAVLAALLPSSIAFASRPPTPEEAEFLLDLADLSAECALIEISTADDRWASVTSQPSDTCETGDGYIVFRHRYGGWGEVFQGSDGLENCERVDMPVAAGRDLGVCRAPTKRKYAVNYLKNRLVFKPKLLPNGVHSAYVDLKWSSWGGNKTKATGILDYADAYDVFREPVTITLRGEQFCGLQRTYKRIVSSEVRHDGRVAFPRENRRLMCP